MLVLVGVAWSLLFGSLLSGPRVAGTRTLGDPGFTFTALERRGEALYAANCLSCHGGPTGGAMMDYPPKHNASGHTWHHSDCELTEVIKTGSGPMTEMMRDVMASPGAPTMPGWREKLSDEEIDAVLAYIRLMWTPQQRSVQAEITREQCTS
jgi:mono/diheme cytochrome c family protein